MAERTERVGEREFITTEEVGKEYSPEELLAIALRERVFMDQSGGGVTFSGGEPTLQFDFLLETLRLMKNAGINTAIDTSGYVAEERLKALLPFTDIFLYDLKTLDKADHKKYTGVDNALIISNLDLLIRNGSSIMLRIPVIPGVSDSTEYMEKLREFIVSRNSGSIREINLLPYHKTGSSKYKRFKMTDRMAGVEQVPATRIRDYKELLATTGIRIKTGG